MTNDDENAKFDIPRSKRDDTGKYKIVVTNENGEAEGELNVTVLDKPTAPKDLKVSEVFAEHCKLNWTPPEDNGGGEITGKWSTHFGSVTIT